MARTKILILTNSLDGLRSFRKEVVEAIRNLGYEVYISAPLNEAKCCFEEMGCTMIDTRFDRKGKNPLKDMELTARYWWIIRRIKPGAVLSYTIKPNVYGGLACQLSNVPQIANITGLGSAVENGGWLQRLTTMLYRIGLRGADTVFCQNQANLSFCREHGITGKQCLLLPGSGVNLQHHYLQEYPEETEPVRFLFIGRILREKGIEEYLAAACKVKKCHSEVEFHIVGGMEDDYSETVKRMQRDGIILYHGSIEDVRPIIGRCHCLVHPSFYPEGMSNVLLEACAAGRPVITTERPGCGEVVDDGVDGFLVRAKDDIDLTEKLESFIVLPHKRKETMGLAARKKVEQGFDRRKVIMAYLKAIRRVCTDIS